MKLNALMSAIVVAGLGFSASANAMIVDMFDDPVSPSQKAENDVNGTTVASQYQAVAVPSTILTDYRDITVTVISGAVVGDTGATALVGQNASGVGRYSFSADDDVLATGSIQWDGDDAGDIAGLNFDGSYVDLINQPGCPSTGCNAFTSIVLFADQGFEYQIGVYTSDTQYTILTSGSLSQVSNVVPPPYTAPYESNYFFTWFQSIADGGLGEGYQFEDGLPFFVEFGADGAADLTQVDAIEFVINSNSGYFAGPDDPIFAQNIALDLSVDSITKGRIPEPSVLALLGLGLFGLGVMRRKAA